MVSGSLSLPSRGPFHHSLTVLSAIGSFFVFSLGRWSSQIQTGFLVPRPTQVLYQRSHRHFAYGTFTLFGGPSQWPSTMSTVFPLRSDPYKSNSKALQPRTCNGVSLLHTYGLGSSSFARRYLRNRCYFLFLQVLRWFSSLGLPPYGYLFTIQ